MLGRFGGAASEVGNISHGLGRLDFLVNLAEADRLGGGSRRHDGRRGTEESSVKKSG